MQHDEELNDWEMEEEETPPDKLKKKWEKEERSPNETAVCNSCGKRIPVETVACLYCGEAVYHDTGLLGKILRWLKGKWR